MANYEAGAHAAQMKILRQLLLSNESSFGELCAATCLTGDHTTFHIKRLTDSGYVRKKPKTHGVYVLTRVGKEYANRMDTDEFAIEKQPKLSVVLVIENDKGEHLQQQRLKQPYYGYWGHMTGKIRWGETMIEAAALELKEETGLSADLRVAGFYHKLDYDDADGDLLEDKYFCLVHGTNPAGELINDDDGHHNEWMSNEDFMKKDKRFGSVVETTALVRSLHPFIEERKYTYVANDY